VTQDIEIGLLFSRSGGYSLMSEACRSGALSAIADVAADPEFDFTFTPVERDPQGNVDRYAPLCEEIIRSSNARHIIGCTTSWSRKEVIPVLEKYDRWLWYPCPYEGYEANDHVFYTHACPNQHLVPLLSWVTTHFGANAFLTGSNYIWGWEMNRIARDLVADAGGEVLGERNLALGETDIERLVYEIRGAQPSFVLNNLIGPSSYAFLEAMANLGEKDSRFAAANCPVISCNLTECELPAINGAAEGQLTAGPYFVPHDKNGQKHPGGSFDAAAYSAVIMLAQAIRRDKAALRSGKAETFHSQSFATPFGETWIDRRNHHCTLPAVVGRIEGDAINPIHCDAAVEPDPYLSRYDQGLAFPRPNLRVVS
tara:strand:+ start:9007 stop:10113 length:1107 start_codon:yes stop_codon:yes gene_type:complete